MSMEVRAFQVEYFGYQQVLSVVGTQIKLINSVRVVARVGVHISDVLRNVKREVSI